MNLRFEAVGPDNPRARYLIAELDRDMAARYPAESLHLLEPAALDLLVLALLDGEAVACGGLRALEPGTGEVKRIFVLPRARGRGLAGRLLTRLEELAREQGFDRLRLETGARQPEAVALFEGAGYRRIPRFGEYAADPLSLCYEKSLDSCENADA